MSDNAFTRIPESVLKQLVSESSNIAMIFRRLGLNITGSQYALFKRVASERGIDISHFSGKPSPCIRPRVDLKDMLKKNTPHSSSTLKNKILQYNLLPYECEECHNKGEWNNKNLVLQLDHKDGERTNNELSNLRFLCPNCHSQTPTHSRGSLRLKSSRLAKSVEYRCPKCGEIFKGKGDRCLKCANLENAQKLISKNNWPTAYRIQELVWTYPMTKAAAIIGKAPNGLKKFCKRNGIILPPQGYWQRRSKGYSHEESMISQKKIRLKAKRISSEEIEKAKSLIRKGQSLRKAAKEIGCAHTTLLDKLAGDPVLLLITHGNAKHIKSLDRD